MPPGGGHAGGLRERWRFTLRYNLDELRRREAALSSGRAPGGLLSVITSDPRPGHAAELERHCAPMPPPVFLQLDDLDAAGIDRVKPLAFLTLDTSPGNHQAWFALAGHVDPDLTRRVRKGAGADPTASGATRIAGSLNFKDKYAPDFPRVRVGHLALQRTTTAIELERFGLVAPAEPVRQARPTPHRPQGERKWPDYQRCLDGAPLNHAKTGPDTSRADFTWCMVASDWGWSIEDTARRLMDESGKARENGDGYAMVTARKAADAAARRTGAPATRPPGLRMRP